MIRHISGTVAQANLTNIVIDVHGVGYLVYTTAKTGCAIGEPLTLHTHLAVRENAMDLYGFTSLPKLLLQLGVMLYCKSILFHKYLLHRQH